MTLDSKIRAMLKYCFIVMGFSLFQQSSENHFRFPKEKIIDFGSQFCGPQFCELKKELIEKTPDPIFKLWMKKMDYQK